MERKIGASIVLYNPDINRLRANIISVMDQVDEVILVDNASENIDAIEQLDVIKKKCVLLKNKNNFGLAKALNQAMEYAQKNDYKWVLTLDQDSICGENLVEGLSRHIDKENVGIIAPKFIDRNSKRPSDKEQGWRYIQRCITSASLTNVNIWYKVGGFNEQLFIDYVDYDFCAKLVRNGYAIIRDSDVSILHEIGFSKQLFWGKRSYILFNHSAMRDYYIVRNTLYYCYAYPDVWNVRKERRDLLFRCLMIIIFEGDRVKKANAILRGWLASKKLIKETKKEDREKRKNIRNEFIDYVNKKN